MADYFTHFSLEVPLTTEQKDWGVDRFNEINAELDKLEEAWELSNPGEYFDADEHPQCPVRAGSDFEWAVDSRWGWRGQYK